MVQLLPDHCGQNEKAGIWFQQEKIAQRTLPPNDLKNSRIRVTGEGSAQAESRKSPSINKVAAPS